MRSRKRRTRAAQRSNSASNARSSPLRNASISRTSSSTNARAPPHRGSTRLYAGSSWTPRGAPASEGRAAAQELQHRAVEGRALVEVHAVAGVRNHRRARIRELRLHHLGGPLVGAVERAQQHESRRADLAEPVERGRRRAGNAATEERDTLRVLRLDRAASGLPFRQL